MEAEIQVEVANPTEWKVALAKVVLGSIAGFAAQVGTNKLVDKVVEIRKNNDTIEVPVP